MLDAFFVAACGVIFVGGIILSWFYWSVVLPTLGRFGDPATMALMPSRQLAQVRRYLQLSERHGVGRPYHRTLVRFCVGWYYFGGVIGTIVALMIWGLLVWYILR